MGNGGIEGNAIYPGAEFTIAPEAGKRFPKLYNHFLVKVFLVGLLSGIESAYLMNNSLIGLYPVKEFQL
jgi:hypothetical protein